MTENYDNQDKKAKKTLYVYDRICPKDSKQHQIYQEYGNTRLKKQDAHYSGASGHGSGHNPGEYLNMNRPYGKAFAQEQYKRARKYDEAHPYARQRRNAQNQQDASRVYGYRPGSSGGAGYGERVKSRAREERPLKIIIERIINLFESIEDRGRADEQMAKRMAIAKKRWLDHRNAIFTAVILIAVAVLFTLFTYKIFFVIENVDVSGSDTYSSEDIVSQSGIGIGDNLYSFDKSAVESDITLHFPYIKSAEITRNVPKSISIAVEEDEAIYFANIWGEYVVLSANMRALENVERSEAKERGLIEIVLPPVSYSVSGRVVKFQSARNERFVRDVLSEVRDSVLFSDGIIDKIDLSNEFNITMQVGQKYLLKLGGESDCDLKLRMADRTIKDVAKENSSAARVDLTIVGEATIKFDMQLVLD